MGISNEDEGPRKLIADLERKLTAVENCGEIDFLKQIHILSGNKEGFVEATTGYSTEGNPIDYLSPEEISEIRQQAIRCEAIPKKIRGGVSSMNKLCSQDYSRSSQFPFWFS